VVSYSLRKAKNAFSSSLKLSMCWDADVILSLSKEKIMKYLLVTYLLVTLFLMIWVKAHPRLERDNMLHEAGVPEDFILLFNEYIGLAED